MILTPVSDFVGFLQIDGYISAAGGPVPVFEPYCKVNNELSNLILYSEVGETTKWHMDYIFQGFNLTFQSSDMENLTISQRVQKLESDDNLKFQEVLGSDELLLTDGSATFVSLVENGADYDIIFSPGAVNKLPTYSSVFPLVSSENYKCFDLVQVHENLTLVDCIQ